MACSATAPAVLFSECLLDTGHPYLNSIGCGPPSRVEAHSVDRSRAV
jgi:hypothetical protein